MKTIIILLVPVGFVVLGGWFVTLFQTLSTIGSLGPQAGFDIWVRLALVLVVTVIIFPLFVLMLAKGVKNAIDNN